MITRYVPTEVIYDGVTYEVGNQQIPQVLYDYIENHPQWSQMLPPEPIDKYAYLKHQDLAFLKNTLAEYEEDLERYSSQIKTQIFMTGTAPPELLTNRIRVLDQYKEIKAHVQPLIATKEAEESARRERIVARSKANGSSVTFNEDGSWFEINPHLVIRVKDIK